LCKEVVGWIVDLNNFLASWSRGLTWWAGQLERWHLYTAWMPQSLIELTRSVWHVVILSDGFAVMEGGPMIISLVLL